MASSSSTKKAARLAQKGKGKKVRFQGGTVFPAVVAAVLVIGVGLIAYARASQPAVDSVPPQISDHWHAAYAFQLCSTTADYALRGDLEERTADGRLVDEGFRTTGVHSHTDGVIHWHPYAVTAVGRRAKLGVFNDNYGITITDKKLELPENRVVTIAGGTSTDVPADFPLVYEAGVTKCNIGGQERDATLKVVVWSDHRDPDSEATFYTSFDDIPFNRNGMAITYAFVPDDVEVVRPSWWAELDRLGALDGGPEMTIPPELQEGADGTAVANTATDGSAPDGTATDGTVAPAAGRDGAAAGETTPPTTS